MKKYFIALILGMGLLSMQTASAATLTLNGSSNPIGTTGSFVVGVTGFTAGDVLAFTPIFGSSLSFNGSGTGIVNFSFTNAAGGGLVTLSSDTMINLLVSGTGSFVASLGSIVNGGFVPDGAVSGVVPVPAAMWLFGSALMGLVGVARRKSQAVLAA
jgi:hypothetical protein